MTDNYENRIYLEGPSRYVHVLLNGLIKIEGQAPMPRIEAKRFLLDLLESDRIFYEARLKAIENGPQEISAFFDPLKETA